MLNRHVIKIGGGDLEDDRWLAEFGRAMRDRGPSVIVHGGGHAITARQQALGIPVERSDGIRTTSAALASVVREVLCGPVRDRIVQTLQRAGLDPVGVSGCDGLLTVEVIDEPGLGMVGRVVDVDVAELEALLLAGKTPVLAPVSLDSRGRVVNVNADEAAAAVAAQLGADELIMVTDVRGVLEDGLPLARITPTDIGVLVSGGAVSDGMVAKLDAVQRAAVPARIGDLGMLRGRHAGTTIVPGVRPAAA